MKEIKYIILYLVPVLKPYPGSDFLTSYGTGSGSTSRKVTVPTVPFPVPNTESKTTERLVLYLSDHSGGLEGNSAEVHKLESQTFFFVVESYCPTLGIRMGSVHHNQYCMYTVHECSVPRTA